MHETNKIIQLAQQIAVQQMVFELTGELEYTVLSKAKERALAELAKSYEN